MPQLIALVLPGRPLCDTLDLSQIGRALSAAREGKKSCAIRPLTFVVLKDLGNLEWDEAAGVYRPSKPVR